MNFFGGNGGIRDNCDNWDKRDKRDKRDCWDKRDKRDERDNKAWRKCVIPAEAGILCNNAMKHENAVFANAVETHCNASLQNNALRKSINAMDRANAVETHCNASLQDNDLRKLRIRY